MLDFKSEYRRWLHERDKDHDDYDGHPDRTPDEIREWADEHDLPYFDDEMHFPDVRIEYRNGMAAGSAKTSRSLRRTIAVRTEPAWHGRASPAIGESAYESAGAAVGAKVAARMRDREPS